MSSALLVGAVALLGAFALASCDDDETPAGVVGPADAITAVVAWQAGEQEPVIADDGEVQLPVIYVVADAGTTIDVGVQAAVAASTVDWATVRFADDIADTFDPGPRGRAGAQRRRDAARRTDPRSGTIDRTPAGPLHGRRRRRARSSSTIVSEPAPDDTTDVPAPRATVTSATQL